MTLYLPYILAGMVIMTSQVSADSTIIFGGTLINAPVCTINGNNIVDVNFGDEIISRLTDGVNYKKQIEYALDCTSVASNGMKIALSGTGASFGTGLLSTTKSGLAIQLYHDDTRLENGKAVPFSYPSTPALYAAPIAQDSTTLTAGSFTGTASLILNYQ
ncbi:fimbrial protein [Enterobacter sp. Acro-832]|uniref:fimbrial protein n=1 Tax=Enterobacter sp. Acro-832 TaxID=2608348 RepID=UPI00142133F7|nr:fimbrial protein [Enterobacter sp. Acro-832]NIG46426.1 fimbrial protein [Enterobacter sp. Acro-832]